MKTLNRVFFITTFLLFLSSVFVQQSFAQEGKGVTLNGKKRPILFKNSLFKTSISTILTLDGVISGTGYKNFDLGSGRILWGSEKEWAGIHFDLNFRGGEKKWQFMDPNFLKQSYFQIDFMGETKAPVKIRFGRFRTAAGQLVLFSYDEVLAKGHSFGSPFVGLYGDGIQIESIISSRGSKRKYGASKSAKVTLLIDVTNKTDKFVSEKPKYDGYSTAEVSVAIITVVPKYYVTTKIATQISLGGLFTRIGTSLDWYNPNDGWVFLSGNFFYERNSIKNFINFSATTGLRLWKDTWEFHTQVENGPEFWNHKPKKIFLTFGNRLKLKHGNSDYLLTLDYQIPVDETGNDWRVNVRFLVFTDFN